MFCNMSYLQKYVTEQVGISEYDEKTYLFLSLFCSVRIELSCLRWKFWQVKSFGYTQSSFKWEEGTDFNN